MCEEYCNRVLLLMGTLAVKIYVKFKCSSNQRLQNDCFLFCIGDIIN